MYEIESLNSQNYRSLIHESTEGMPCEDDLSLEEKKCQADTILHRIAVLSNEGKMVGYGRCVSGSWDPSTKPGYFDIYVAVAKDWQGEKFGEAIVKYLAHYAQNNGGHVLTTTVKDSNFESIVLFEQLGFAKRIHNYMSVLDLLKFEPSAFRDALETVNSLHLKFATLANYPDTEETFNHFMDFFFELAVDAPNSDGFVEDRNTMKYILKNVAPWEPAGILLVVDGDRWIAMSVVIREPNGWFNCVLTGVSRDYRRKGLATGVKVKAAEHAKNSGGKFLRTFNDSSNEKILRVNHRMGFEAQHGSFTLEKMI